ncbi:MAG: type IV pilus assembly protein PilX [Gammaproteobacteria bacterium]|jgi:type IV pilus assembly protein PilX
MNKLTLQTQSGVTLVFSLVILATLTILGVTSFQNTRTEISMAGNLRESSLTFNAAEAGLRAAENFIGTSISATIYADTPEGLYDDSDLDPNYVDTATWAALPYAATSLAHVLEQPKYIIKYLGDRSQNEVAKVNIGGYGSSQPGITVSNFRVTARGTGQSGNARRYVQSYFGKEF